MKKWFAIKAAAPGSGTAEISVFSEIGEGGVRAPEFIAALKAITAPNIRLLINSPGGSVFEALAIFNALRVSGKNIEVHVLGIAASAASYLAMVGNKIVMPGNTYMFLHNPINGVYGNAGDMREMADILDKLGTSLTAEYAKRFKGTDAALDKLLADESYLSAAECLAYGLCDEVTDEIEATAEFNIERLPRNVRAVFKAIAPPVPASTVVDTILARVKEAGLQAYTSAFLGDKALTTVAAAKQAVADAREIMALAKHTGLIEMAEPLIRSRKTTEQARHALAKALADADVHIDTSRRSESTGFSPAALWAEIRAMKGKHY